MDNNNRCVCCGDIIPEGRQVCLICEEGAERKYWARISKIQERQTRKGIANYGQILEANTGMSIKERLEYYEEELIDALMYIEHIKEVLIDD